MMTNKFSKKCNTSGTMAEVRQYQMVHPALYAYIKLSQGIQSAAALQVETQVSRAHIYRIWNRDWTKPMQKGKSTGRPRKITEKSTRKVMRLIPKMRKRNYNWTVGELMQEASLEDIHSCTLNRLLNRNGFWHFQMRKKGLLSDKDKRDRLRFARKMLRRKDVSTYWTEGISFYLDAVSFVYKSNPRENAAAPSGRCFRRKAEGLTATAKGSVSGTGGKYVRVIAAISHGHGVVWASTYEKMTGASFASFVEQHFDTIFERCGKKSNDVYIWLQDGDKCQNSKKAKDALKKVSANVIQRIPPRSPDLNPIENIFNVVKRRLKRQAIDENIEKESKPEYEARVLKALMSYPVTLVNNTIQSMETRLRLVEKGNGSRTKY